MNRRRKKETNITTHLTRPKEKQWFCLQSVPQIQHGDKYLLSRQLGASQALARQQGTQVESQGVWLELPVDFSLASFEVKST